MPPGGQLHHRVLGNHVRPTRRNRRQMITFLVEVHSVLTPGVEISHHLELLAGPRMKRMGDSETSIQTARSRRS
jgi:hypothetical protein